MILMKITRAKVMDSEFNPEKLYIQFSEMWKTAEKLGRGQYTHYESFSKSFFLLDMERAIFYSTF
jgi:hypothetical protein